MAEAALHIGVGNSLRRDDGVGPWVATRLARAGRRARVWTADGAGLVDLLATEPRLVLIDATQSGAPAGKLVRIDAATQPLPSGLFRNSTHEFGLAEAVEVARRLAGLPAHLEVIGIEGADFSHGDALTGDVLRAARVVVEELLRRPRGMP